MRLIFCVVVKEKGRFCCSSGNTVYCGPRVALAMIDTVLESSERSEEGSIYERLSSSVAGTFFEFFYQVSSVSYPLTV